MNERCAFLAKMMHDVHQDIDEQCYAEWVEVQRKSLLLLHDKIKAAIKSKLDGKMIDSDSDGEEDRLSCPSPTQEIYSLSDGQMRSLLRECSAEYSTIYEASSRVV